MDKFIVRYYPDKNRTDYSDIIMDKLWGAESAEQAENMHRQAFPETKIISSREVWEQDKGTFFKGVRVVRGAASELSDRELLQWLANASVTYASCGGHGKANRNRKAADRFREMLEDRGVEIPETQQLYDQGVFNGPGSS